MNATESKWVGKSIPRKEDDRFLTGQASYVDDMKFPGMLYCAILRSPYAHARIKKVNASAARKIPGVVAVITGEDMKPYPLAPQIEWAHLPLKSVDGQAFSIAFDKVRFVGEPVAAVAAVDRYVAEDALDLIEVEYEPMPAVVDMEAALEKGAPLLYDEWGDNVQLSVKTAEGDIEKAFREADRIVEGRISEHRYSGFPIEPRSILASYHPADRQLEVWTSTQGVFQARTYLARTLKIPEQRIRVVAPNVGGAFGNKMNWWVETIPALLSIKTGRPVKFTENRLENLMTAPHSRDYRQDIQVACKKDGTILGMKMRMILDVGVEASHRGSSVAILLITSKFCLGPYKIPNYSLDLSAVVTNKSSGGPYRGFGKDIANRVMERMINIISRELGLLPEEVRRRNFISAEEFPYRQSTGALYDSGNFPKLLEKALDKLEVDSLRREKARLQGEGRYIGIGIASKVEPAGAAVPSALVNGIEGATLRIMPEGGVLLLTAHPGIGQGTETTLAQVVADELEMNPEEIRVVSGDTDAVPMGSGAFSSRGAVWTVSAAISAARKMKEKIIRIGAHLLQARPEEVGYQSSRVFVKAEPSRSLSLKEISRKCTFWPGAIASMPPDLLYTDSGLEVTSYWMSPNPPTSWTPPVNLYTTTPSASEIAVVEVDVETGRVKVLKYVTVHDCGRLIHPQIVEKQILGGIMQGIGGTLYEEIPYDENGQPLATTFMDYLMPTAMEIPEVMEFGHLETYSPFTPLGTKGMGEGAAIAAPSAVVNAVEDALGITVTQTPLKPETVLELVKKAKENGLL